jgi:hypothetical protein
LTARGAGSEKPRLLHTDRPRLSEALTDIFIRWVSAFHIRGPELGCPVKLMIVNAPIELLHCLNWIQHQLAAWGGRRSRNYYGH